MKLKLPTINIAQIIWSIRYSYIIVILMVIVVFFSLGMFIYNHLYLTITRARTIVILKQEVAPDTINLSKIEVVLQKINQKTTAESRVDWATIKDPFGLVASDPAATPPLQID